MSAALLPESQLALYDHPALQQRFVAARDDGLREATLVLEGIRCGGCVRRCERGLVGETGVVEFEVNLTTRRARLVWDPARTALSRLLQRLGALGHPAWPYDSRRQEARARRERNRMLCRLAVAGLGMMQVMMFAVALYAGAYQDMDADMRQFLRWMSLLVATPVVLYSAQPFFLNAWSGLRHRQLGMDVPVAIAIGGAYLASLWATFTGAGEVYFDSVTMFTFLLLLGRFLEMNARHRAAAASEDLTRLLPALANRLEGTAETTVAVADLIAGDRVLVRPGETVPADGRIEEGVSSLDESLVTGESRPRTRRPGDAVTGGTINVESPLAIGVTGVGEATVLAAMNRLLTRAQLEKPRLARLADRVAGGFVAALLLVAAGVYLWWAQHAPADAFWITLSVLVVTCPCALSLATPTALTAATGALTRRGLLTTRGHALETLARVDHLVLDKTGTLTRGRLQLSAVRPLRGHSADYCLRQAAALEARSEHPVARALRQAARDDTPSAEDLHSQPGEGVEGRIDGRIHRIGTHRFVAGDTADADDDTGASVVWLGDEQGPLARFVLTDEPRPEAAAVIARLHALGVGLEILSGDTPSAVDRVASRLGIDHWQGGLRPEDKLARLEALQHSGRVVAMVGDGVNDSPVLARAQVSVAMGSGTEIARNSADMVLLGERLDPLPEGIRLARRTLTVIRQNLFWALGYNAVALPLAAAGQVAPWMAALGMSLSSLVVVLNALRLSRTAPQPAAPDPEDPDPRTVVPVPEASGRT
ncbi:MAG: heavy metal translocating P-type ATPase [Candidatus Competibacterales bacterium]|nr:heavy metal translocating P-type ATPase [Candidatus Competibacterales bacterium]